LATLEGARLLLPRVPSAGTVDRGGMKRCGKLDEKARKGDVGNVAKRSHDRRREPHNVTVGVKPGGGVVSLDLTHEITFHDILILIESRRHSKCWNSFIEFLLGLCSVMSCCQATRHCR